MMPPTMRPAEPPINRGADRCTYTATVRGSLAGAYVITINVFGGRLPDLVDGLREATKAMHEMGAR